MSSHHFVREDQEPALVILDTREASFESIQELLEWSPTVIVSEYSLQQVLLWGIKVDIVVALEENVSKVRNALLDQFPLKLLSCQSTDEYLSTALYFLIALKQKAVNILSGLPLHTFAKFDALDLSVFQSNKKWSFIRSGEFEKWFAAGRVLFILTEIEETITISKDGLVNVKKENGFWIAED